MSLDTLTDPVVATFGALFADRITNELEAQVETDKPVRGLLGHPVDVGNQVGNQGTQSLPLLAVSVVKAKVLAHGANYIDETLTVRIDYVMQPTPSAQMGARWPALRAVWNIIRRALEDGKLSNGERVLTPELGVMRIDYNSIMCDFGWMDGATAMPSFTAEFQFHYREPADAAATQPLIELYTSFSRLPDGGNPANQPELVSRATAP